MRNTQGNKNKLRESFLQKKLVREVTGKTRELFLKR